MKRQTMLLAAACLLASAVLLLLCSQSSPLYPTNVWVDANCLLTVGRVMKEGGVLYRDIYEQKGPTLYLMHTIAACISDTSFLGVYVMEVVSFAATLFLACRLAMRRAGAWADAVLAGACVLVGQSFSRGDSAEEACLPFLMAALLLAFGEYGGKKGPMRTKPLFVCGLLAGFVATIKFTVLGLFVGLCAAEGVLALREGGIKRALHSAGAFLAGMLLPIAAWCAYFAAHGALADFYTAYVHNNIFLYTDETRTLLDMLRDVWNAARGNALWVLFACIGMAAFLLDKRESLQLKLCILAMAAGAFASVFLLGRTWFYSPMALSVFAFMWAPSFGSQDEKKALRTLRSGAACVLALVAALCLSPNAFLRGVPFGTLAQARLAKFVHPGATVLQYSHLDDGLYLASGALPVERYFCRLNVSLPKMDEALDMSVEEARTDYVLVSWEKLPERFDGYQLIAEDVGYDDQGRLNKMLYLYRRK